MHQGGFELRLGLVLYGGSSLAVYMSGMTHELLALARAGHARRLRHWLEAGARERPDWDAAWVRRWVDRQERENPYLPLLDQAGIDVVIDVLAGTSAGGLNGLLLAKALACGAPDLDGLSELWRDTAQIADLARHDPSPRSVLSGAYLQDQLAAVMRSLSNAGRPELAGMCDVLDLFITATDVRGHAWTRFDRFHQRIDGTSHKYLFRLKKRTPYGHGGRIRGYSRDDFTAEQERQPLVDRLLAKIGSATAAFPGVFPPVRISPREAREAKVGVLQDLGPEYDDGVWFSDGGMLLNAPFEPVLETVVDRRANRPVKRVLAFLEPDPALPSDTNRSEPAMLETVFSAVTLPMQQDIRENLDRLGRENRRRTRLMELMKGLDHGMGYLARAIPVTVMGRPGARPEPEMDTYAVTRAYYQMRLNRLHQMLRDAMARALAAEGLEADAVARGTGWILAALEPPGDAPLADRPDDLLPFLDVFDLDFHARRIHYLLGRLHDQYRPGRAAHRPGEMARMLDLLWGAAADWRYGLWLVSQVSSPSVTFTLWEAEAGRLGAALAALAGALRDGAPDGGAVAAGVAAALTAFLEAVHATADGEVQEALALADLALEGVGELTGDRLRLAYTEFDALDVVLFPVAVGAGLDGWGEIGLYGLRPTAATWSGLTGPEKLTGVGLGHFAAFLDPRWRSNDIMWGRLDGAELLFRMLARETGRGDEPPPEWQEQLTRRRRQILSAFPDLVDVARVRSLALLDGAPGGPGPGGCGPAMPMRERLAQAYQLVRHGEAYAARVASAPAPTLEDVPDAVLREYLANHFRVARSGLDDLPPRRLAAEILLMLDNTVQALSVGGGSPLVRRLQGGLTVLLRPLNWVARLILLPRQGLAGQVAENLGPLMTLVGAVLLLGWAVGAVKLSPAGNALTLALFLPALLDVLVRPTWARVLLLGLPALVTGLAAAALAWEMPWLPGWLAWAPLGRLWAPFALVFAAALVAWWTAWRWRGPLRRLRRSQG